MIRVNRSRPEAMDEVYAKLMSMDVGSEIRVAACRKAVARKAIYYLNRRKKHQFITKNADADNQLSIWRTK